LLGKSKGVEISIFRYFAACLQEKAKKYYAELIELTKGTESESTRVKHAKKYTQKN